MSISHDAATALPDPPDPSTRLTVVRAGASNTDESVPDGARMGRILVEDGLLQPEQLRKGERIQARLETKKPLSALVVELGWVSKSALESALRRHRRELSVEGILLEKGTITLEQLSLAREAVKGTPGKTAGRHLVEIGAVSERTYLDAHCEKHGMPFVDADVSLVDPKLIEKVSLRYLTKHQVLPLSIQDGVLNVVLHDPGRTAVLTELERLYGCPVHVCLGESTKIAATFAVLANEGTTGTRATTGHIQYHRLTEVGDQGKAAGEIVDNILAKALRDGASDIHVEPMQDKLRVRFRVDGSLVHVSDYPASVHAERDLAHQGARAGRHRRAAHPPGRSHLRAERRRGNRPARIVLRHGLRRERRPQGAAQGARVRRPRGNGPGAGHSEDLHGGRADDLHRHPARHRPHRKWQDDDAVRCRGASQRRLQEDHHVRGPGRVP